MWQNTAHPLLNKEHYIQLAPEFKIAPQVFDNAQIYIWQDQSATSQPKQWQLKPLTTSLLKNDSSSKEDEYLQQGQLTLATQQATFIHVLPTQEMP